MVFKIVVVTFILYLIVDSLLSRIGKRALPFLKPKTIEHLSERRKQISWILRYRDIPPELRASTEKILDTINETIASYRTKRHEQLVAIVAQVDDYFRTQLRPFKRNWMAEFIDSVWWVVLIALCIRFFLFESFRVPTGSMVPNIYIGDMLFVNKYIYGLRPPLTRWHFFRFKEPTRGEVVVFIFPEQPSQDFVKRVIGLPGDRVRLEGRRIFVNGKELQRERIGTFTYVENNGNERHAEWYRETNGDGVSYEVLYSSENEPHLSLLECRFCESEFTVPPHSLFVMGDNRDVSLDSRYWGFVPYANLKGRASMIWFSVSTNEGFHLERIGRFIK